MDAAPASAAVSRARAALLEHLSPAQRAEFERTGTFTVRGRWWRRYTVGRKGRVCTRYIFGRVKCVFGIWLDQRVLEEDKMLAMKLFLEADERGFLRTACKQLDQGQTPGW